MGVVAETFRKQRGVKRSNNPDASFAAWGKHRDYITQDHPLYPLFGEDSPVGRIYALGGWVLMLGVGHGTNTSLHLAEYRANIHHPIRHDGRPLWVNGRIEWQAHDDIDWDDDDFEALGADFARETGLQKEGPVAFGQALLVPQVPLIDYGVKWLESHRAKPG
jgi:aminoglycoside 3-N-acetyltransferase